MDNQPEKNIDPYLSLEENTRRNEEILLGLPDDARINVVDQSGRNCWRKKTDLLPTDVIQYKLDGTPAIMSSPPGRQRSSDVLTPPNEVIAEKVRRKSLTIREDPIARSIRISVGAGAKDPLTYIMEAMSEEVAAMQFERQECERTGDSEMSGTLSMRRVNALKTLGDTWLKRAEQLASSGVDLNSPAFERVFEFTLQTLFECLEHRGIPADTVQSLASDISKRVTSEHWRAEAEKKIIKG